MRILATIVSFLLMTVCKGQNVPLEGYVYEKGNRGYLAVVEIKVEDSNDQIISKTFTDNDGYFRVEVPANADYKVYYYKDMFVEGAKEVHVGREKAFVKIEMGRAPGYVFEVTLAEKRDDENVVVDAIRGARVEIYNDTKKEVIADFVNEQPAFNMNLHKGNRYTILVRKKGYLAKRMEVKVDVEGCILCFEGVGRVTPGVSDNLTEGNEYGVLLANVELERIYEGKKMNINNIHYASNKWNLNGAAMQELSKVAMLMADNPQLRIQLGSHTDCQGDDQFNLELSQKRAKECVDFLVNRGGVPPNRISWYGYGESDPIDDCGGSCKKCTQAQLAKNRRTELQILEINDVSAQKSLAQMKKMEEMEGMIDELLDQEVIKVKDEKELEEKVKMKKEKNLPKHMPTDKSGRPENNLPPAESVPPTHLPIGKIGNATIRKDVDGPMIIIAKAPVDDQLPRDHEIFSKFGEIYVYNNGDGRIFYMIGGFNTVNEMINHYDKVLAKDYPHAILAKFVDGKMGVVNR